MQKYLTIKNLFLLTAVTIIAYVIAVVLKALNPVLPKIISSNPANNSANVTAVDSIILKFDIPVSGNRLAISSTPTESWQINQVDTQEVSLNHSQYLLSNTNYSIVISYKGKQIGALDFKTLGGGADPRYYQQIQATIDHDYPLGIKLPYETAQYRVVYSAPMTLEITIKNPNISSTDAITDIKTWVTSVGGDAAAHQYVVK